MKYNDLYRYETKDTHNIHINKLNTITFIDMSPKTHTQHTHKQIKYNDLYRYETKETHNIHTNKLNTMSFIDVRQKTHITYTQTN